MPWLFAQLQEADSFSLFYKLQCFNLCRYNLVRRLCALYFSAKGCFGRWHLLSGSFKALKIFYCCTLGTETSIDSRSLTLDVCTVLVELHFCRINICTEKVLEGFGRPSPSAFICFNSLVLVSLTVKCLRNKPAYFAERLYKSMKVKSFWYFPRCLFMLESLAWQQLEKKKLLIGGKKEVWAFLWTSFPSGSSELVVDPCINAKMI